jgi:hypothetical protein
MLKYKKELKKQAFFRGGKIKRGISGKLRRMA